MQLLRFSSAGRDMSNSRSRATELIRAFGLSAVLALAVPAFASANSFTDIAAGATGVHHGSSIWGDYNNDDDLDLLLTGEKVSPLAGYADIYQNNPLGTFTAISAGLGTITGSNSCSRSAWGDFNNDGLLDLIVTGQSGTTFSSSTTLYRNTGSGFVVETVTSSALQNVSLGSASWGDYDNDGDLDLFITGYVGSVGSATIYRNDGDNGSGGWTFTDIDPFASYPYHRLYRSDGAWGDYDNDGDLDLVVEGVNQIGASTTTLYRNDGGVFVQSSFTGFTNVGEGSVSWGDLNGDGWLDLVLTGTPSYGGPLSVCNVYTNNHNGTFSLSQSLTGLCNSSTTLGDYNNDGKLDLVATGITWFSGTPSTFAYFGTGSGTFTLDALSGLTGLYEGQVSFGDYDNDGRLDLVLTGRDVPISTAYTKIYHNTTGVSANTLPSTPAGLAVTNTTWNSITVQWSLSSDAQSPTSTLTYNLKVDDQTASTTVMVPMSNTSGYRQVPALGNTNHNATWTIQGLTPGHTYGFSVQAIDQAWAASALCPVVTATTSNISTRPDVMIGDCSPASGYTPGDLGVEPNAGCGTVYYNSPNIWIRTSPDGTLPGHDVSQNPVAGGTNYVYARVKNISPSIMTHGKVYFYFSKAGTAFTWPLHWTGYYSGPTLEGDLIAVPGASAEVNYLSGGGAETIVSVAWPNTPGFSHFCILARFVAASDPMTYAEGSSTITNTQNDNNIAWRNITVSSGGSGTSYHGNVNLNNLSAELAHIDLHVNVPDGEIGDAVLNHVKIKLHLGRDLFDRWQQEGMRGHGFEIAQNDDGTPNDAVWINQSGATLENIPMDPNQQVEADLETVFPKDLDKAVAGNVYHLDLAQYTSGYDTPDGGEFYEIDMPTDRPAGKMVLASNTLAAKLELSARPNPTSGVTTINYTLPENSRVTVNLYDATGRMIRNLVPSIDQQAGHHEVMWNGTAIDGRDLPSGVYFYRVRTSTGVAEGKITITR